MGAKEIVGVGKAILSGAFLFLSLTIKNPIIAIVIPNDKIPSENAIILSAL